MNDNTVSAAENIAHGEFPHPAILPLTTKPLSAVTADALVAQQPPAPSTAADTAITPTHNLIDADGQTAALTADALRQMAARGKSTAMAGTGIADAAKRLTKNAHNKPKASPLLNSLIKRVVKEQEEKEEGMRWEHLVNMHNQIGQYLLNLTTVAAFMRNKILLAAVQDRELLLKLVKVLAKDMQSIQKRANATADQYPVKTGAITDDQDMLRAIGIYEEYNQILLDIVNVVMPTSNEVMEMFTVAERIIVEQEAVITAQLAEQQAAALLDPTVISDVPVKEVISTKDAVSTQPEV